MLLLLQGQPAHAEACLLATLQMAEETNQDTCWVDTAALLSTLYYQQGREQEGQVWFERSLQRGQLLSETSWWPRLRQANFLFSKERFQEAEQVLRSLQAQFPLPQQYPSFYYGAQIDLGHVLLAYGDLEQARALFHDGLAHRPDLSIESYVRAELGLADIARQRKHDQEAYQRYLHLLAFCGKRGLLYFYGTVSFKLAQLLQESKHIAAVSTLLEETCRHLKEAGYTHLHQQCLLLLTA
jgi:tetratricopeptide (TPR) repeat protein